MSSTDASVGPPEASTPPVSSTPAPSETSAPQPPSSFTQTTGDNGETTVLDDVDPSITYTNSGTDSWNVTSDTLAYNRTMHQTSCNSCPATLLFNGTGLSLTSILSTQGSNFKVWLDGAPAGPYSLSNSVEQSARVYSIEGLQYLLHNATFMKDGDDSTFFNIDSITVISRPSVGGASYIPPTASGRTSASDTQTGASPTNSNAPVASASSPPPIGAIVGGTVGGIALIIVVVAWIIIMRRRKSRAESGPVYAEDRYANDRYAKERYAEPAQTRYAGGSRHSGERYRSGYTDPRYADARYANGYSASNNGYSRGYPSSKPSSRY